MYRRKVMMAAVAVFAIGVALAAQPTSLRANWGEGALAQGGTWVPGTNSLMSTYESGTSDLRPPR